MNITVDDLEQYRDRHLVASERHTRLPVTLWHYTPSTAASGAWDGLTRACTGLLVDDSGQVVGRRWPKILPWGDPLVPAPRTRYTAYDKYDGVPISVTEFDGELLVWSGDTFESEAIEAARKHLTGWRPNSGTTAMFEALLPGHRNVVDYGDYDGLVLLGEVSHDDGWDAAHPDDVAHDTGWSGEIAVERNGIMPKRLADMCANPENGEGREGFVVVYGQIGGPAVRFEIQFDWFMRRA